MRPANVVICTPVRTDRKVSLPMAQWVLGQMLTFQQAGPALGSLTWDACPSNYIDAARNYLVECHRDADALLCLDSDVRPPEEALLQMLALDKSVVVAPCPIELDGKPFWNIDLNGGGYRPRRYADTGLDEPRRIYRGGTACMLIQRSVFTRLAWPWFRTVMRQVTPQSRELVDLTDDEWFCDCCREKGIEIWVEPRVVCEHPV